MEWQGFEYLLGRWVGEETPGGSGPTSGKGEFTFRTDLDGHVIIRENLAEYPAAGDKPPQVHKDLMVIFRGSEGEVRATYWDTEDNRIEYKVHASPEQGEVTFQSESNGQGPNFRLTYSRLTQGRLRGKFEVRPPGKSDYILYLEWTAVKV